VSAGEPSAYADDDDDASDTSNHVPHAVVIIPLSVKQSTPFATCTACNQIGDSLARLGKSGGQKSHRVPKAWIPAVERRVSEEAQLKHDVLKMKATRLAQLMLHRWALRSPKVAPRHCGWTKLFAWACRSSVCRDKGLTTINRKGNFRNQNRDCGQRTFATALHHLIITRHIRRDEDDVGLPGLPRVLDELHAVGPPATLLGVPQDHALGLDVVVDQAEDGGAKRLFLVGADPDEEPVRHL
jgi:hypothetical protein